MKLNQTEFQIKLGKMVREQRKKAGLKQSDVAKQADMSLAAYLYVEEGHICPDVFTAIMIADALGVKPSFFLDDEKDIA